MSGGHLVRALVQAWAPWVGEQQRSAQPAALTLPANRRGFRLYSGELSTALLGGASPKTEDTHCEQVLSGLRDRQTKPLSKAVSGPSTGTGDGSSFVWIGHNSLRGLLQPGTKH